MKRLHIREFLNPKKGIAAIEVWEGTYEIRVSISDCDKVVDLSFPFSHEKQRKKARHKIDILIDILERTQNRLTEIIAEKDEIAAQLDDEWDEE